MPPSAISGTPALARRAGAVEHRRQLRHTDPRDESRRACEAGPDSHLDGVRAGGGEVGDTFAGRDVAGHDLDVRPGGLQLLHRLDRGIGVAVRDVEHERVDLGLDQRLRANQVVAADPDRGRDPQPAEVVARGAGVAVGEREVAERHEPRHSVVRVDERKLLDPVRGEQAPCVLELDPGPADDEPLSRGHQLVDALAVVAREHVARGQEPEQPLLGIDDDEARHLEAARLGARVRDRPVGLDHVRLTDDVGQVALDPADLRRLLRRPGEIGAERRCRRAAPSRPPSAPS